MSTKKYVSNPTNQVDLKIRFLLDLSKSSYNTFHSKLSQLFNPICPKLFFPGIFTEN